MRLRTRLLLFNAALIPVVMVGVWLGGALRLRNELAESRDASLETGRTLLALTIGDRVKAMELMAQPIREDPQVRDSLASRGTDSGKGAGSDPEYLASFVDQALAQRPGLMLLFGADGRLAYGEVGAKALPANVPDVLEARQLRALLAGLGQRPDGATMLWSGPRARDESTAFAPLESPVYLVRAERLDFHRTGLGQTELEGLAVLGLGTRDFDLTGLKSAHAGLVFADGTGVLQSVFGGDRPPHFDETQTRVAAWLAKEPAHLGEGKRRDWIQLGEGVFATLMDLPALVSGPVRVAIVFSNARAVQRERTLRLASGLIGLLLLGGVVALGLWHVRSVSAPVLVLAEAAKRVGEGDLGVRVADARKDELGDLAREFNHMVQGLEERERARAALGQYLSPEMARRVLSQKDSLGLGGERRELSLLFGDIAGFTTLSERRAPEEIIGFLNEHLDRLIPILSDHGAYIDKFEGDAIMAFWNAPVAQPDHAVRVCSTALALDAAVSREAEAWLARGFPRVAMRWGLNTGDAVVGNLGSKGKANYTAIGDSVNLASRLEGANKLYGTRILVGEGTWAGAKDAFSFRELDRLRVKGRKGGVRVYELLGPRDSLAPERAKVVALFAEGYAAYEAQRFGEAARAFEAAQAASGGTDGPSETFLARARQYAETPPPGDWDGIYAAASKD